MRKADAALKHENARLSLRNISETILAYRALNASSFVICVQINLRLRLSFK